MKYRMNTASNLFLFCFAVFLGIVVIVCLFTKSDRIEMLASVASVSGVLFTVADLYGNHKNDSERINSLIEKVSEANAELRSLRKIRIGKMREYCQIKYDEYSTTSKITETARESTVAVFKRALTITAAIDKVFMQIEKEEEEKRQASFPESLFCRYNRNRLMRVGIAHDFFLIVGFMSILCMLVFYESLMLPPALPNYLTVVGFSLIMIIYVSRDRTEEHLNAATKMIDEHIDDVKKSIEFEQKLMRWMETALYENEESTPQEAEIKLLIYISDFVSAEKE